MDVIIQRYTVLAKPDKVWDALVNPKTIEKWGGGPAVMKDKVGFDFSLWGGDIYGKNIEIENEKKLVQEWYSGEWSRPSVVTITLNADGHCTEIVLEHKDVPAEEMKEISEGWKDFYFEPIKKLLEEKS